MIRRKLTLLKTGIQRNRDGAAAIEFAILVLPLMMLIFGIIEISLMFFADAALDTAVHRVSRSIKTGEAATAGMTLANFKTDICSEMLFAFECTDDLVVKVDILADLSEAANTVAIDSSGKLAVTETFNIGNGSDYVLVQAFLPWTAVVNLFSLSDARLTDGRYVLGAAALFRNEPF